MDVNAHSLQLACFILPNQQNFCKRNNLIFNSLKHLFFGKLHEMSGIFYVRNRHEWRFPSKRAI